MAYAPPLVVPVDMCLGGVRRAEEVHQEKGLPIGVQTLSGKVSRG